MDRKWVFAKMQGLGNDFIVLDLRDPRSLSSLSPRAHEIASRAGLLGEVGSAELSGLARRWCDRHFGIGADGVLLILPSTVAAARMRVLNADGSEAEMCGNGLRCVARRLHEQEGLEEVRIETGAGVLACSMVSGEEGSAVEVSMGRPRFLRAEIPVVLGSAGGEMIAEPVDVLDRTLLVTGVSMGNPHGVVFVPDGEGLEGVARRYGPALERAECFPRGANCSFARFLGLRDIELWVWERGCGLTLACGTGACATAAAAFRLGLLAAEEPVTVRLPGGDLVLRVAAGAQDVILRGPAELVFSGVIRLGSEGPRANGG